MLTLNVTLTRTSRLPRVVWAFALLTALPAAARAQHVVPSLEIGGSRVSYADSVTSSAAVLPCSATPAPSLDHTKPGSSTPAISQP